MHCVQLITQFGLDGRPCGPGLHSVNDMSSHKAMRDTMVRRVPCTTLIDKDVKSLRVTKKPYRKTQVVDTSKLEVRHS
jgi:hypothetical protein